MVKVAQGKQMGQGCPRGNKWDKKAYKQCTTKPKWPYWEKNKQQAQRGLVSLGQITSQQEWQSGTAGNGSKTVEKSKRVGWRKKSPQSKPDPKGSRP